MRSLTSNVVIVPSGQGCDLIEWWAVTVHVVHDEARAAAWESASQDADLGVRMKLSGIDSTLSR